MTFSAGQPDERDRSPRAVLAFEGRHPGRQRRFRFRWPARVTVAVLLVAGAVGAVPEAGPVSLPLADSPRVAAAEDCDSAQESPGGGSYLNSACIPGGPLAPPAPEPEPGPAPADDTDGEENGGGSGGGSSEPVCRYIRVSNPELAIEVYQQAGQDIPEGYPYLNDCSDAEVGGTLGVEHMENLASLYTPADFIFLDEFDYNLTQTAFTVALETELLDDAWAVVEGELDEPEPVVYPPSEAPTLVGVPTLLSVENAQEEIVHENCAEPPAEDVCVSVTATPSLTFDPGDGTDPVSCDPAGTTYDPDGPPVSEQAEGGCAHAYSRVSDAAGYPGRLTLTWDIAWDNTLDESGEFDPVTLPEGDEPNVTRVVQELHAVVDDVEPGGSSE